ncbi:axeA1 [Symbiodinium natans]|uniref:AxeA1 protein n=1 Tax=Symbiodinium natans TaxID=878477 RepID=A0A812UUS4_9DINO|nr:axeA1 [Symbiodinium natans]
MRFLLLCAWPLCWAARQKIPKTKIACVGDSLTAGYPFDSGRGDDPAVSGYPYHLQRLLDEDAYEVRNFGKGETTVVAGSKSYHSAWYNSTWHDALAYRPDRVLLMFGANDVKESRLLKFQTEFEDAYSKLIASFLKVDATVYMLIPPPMYDDNIYGPEFDPPGRAGGMQQTVYNEQLPAKLREIAAQHSKVRVIDLQTCFLKHNTCTDVRVNCCEWEARKPPRRRPREQAPEQTGSAVCLAHDDAIHPNDEGYRNMALMLRKALINGRDPC